MHKLAMILSVATGDSLKINERHLMAANGMLLEMEVDYGEVMEYAQAGGYYSQAKIEVLRIIRDGINDRTALYTQMSTIISGNDFERIIGDLSKANLISQVVKPGGKIIISARTAEVIQLPKPGG